jgi:formiminotetrahydrofolate cyclodeaminase
MVGNLTLGRKKYAIYEEDIRRILDRAESIRLSLLALIDQDAEGFAPLSKAYSIPKEDPDRDRILLEASIQACQAPLEMMRQICAAIELLEELTEKGSVMLLSDVGCGAALCRGALEAASLNIYINTRTRSDRERARQLNEETDALLDTYVPRAQAVTDKVRARLIRA